MTHTLGQKEWLKRRQDVKDGKPIAMTYFKNAAVTKAGDFVIGLSYSIELQRYSCSAIEIDGVRLNDPHRWSKDGIALDGDSSDLVMGSVQVGVRKI